jgi:hypothetical protein
MLEKVPPTQGYIKETHFYHYSLVQTVIEEGSLVQQSELLLPTEISMHYELCTMWVQ